MFAPFANEPHADFRQEGPRRRMREALERVGAALGRTYPLVIGGQPVETADSLVSRNPACPSQVVGITGRATPEHIDRAIQAAAQAYPEWSRTPPEVRARCLVKAAAILRRRIYEFSAWMVYEVSKSWTEAYADAAEAIDFLEFYARQMVRLAGQRETTHFPGEEAEVQYLPLGVGGIISPWNFPLAIFTGMTAGPVVAGNTVVCKPAEQSPVLAALCFQVLEEASLPPGVVNFVPGFGEDAGEALTGDPRIRFVSFTGSKAVGLRIYERVAQARPSQHWLKRAVLEMGGKNAIIVDETADLDAAAEGVVASAFGFQGQKCSACSRLIAHERIHDALLERVVQRAAALKVGDPANPETDMGAVIDEDAMRKILSYIEIGRGEGELVLGGEPLPGEGHFVPPTLFVNVAPGARIAQEEIFGPVLAVLRAADFDEALEIANGTEYGLTGAVYSRDRSRLERARREFHVGNLYFNRKCTGALVDVQPFGGFNMSGTDSKAGGRDYLLLFLQQKAISERW